MLAIKLQRIGKKHQPSYRVVVADRRSKLNAPPVEDLGSYSVSTKAANLKKDRIAYWMKVGAEPTTTMWNLLVREGVISGAKRKIAMKKVLRKDHDFQEAKPDSAHSISSEQTSSPQATADVPAETPAAQ